MLFFKGLITFVWSVCLVFRWWTCAFWPAPARGASTRRPGHAHIPPGVPFVGARCGHAARQQ